MADDSAEVVSELNFIGLSNTQSSGLNNRTCCGDISSAAGSSFK